MVFLITNAVSSTDGLPLGLCLLLLSDNVGFHHLAHLQLALTEALSGMIDQIVETTCCKTTLVADKLFLAIGLRDSWCCGFIALV